MGEVLRILRYNTGTDKKAFVQFKHNFDAVIFNATIVAYSGSSVAGLVSMHKRKYIIDPQTHIFQQDFSAIAAKKGNKIKKSVSKYLDQLPKALSNITINEKRPLSSEEIGTQLDNLVDKVYAFQTKYVKRYIEDKDYNKYLKFVKLEPEPRLIIAPYFMLKDCYTNLELNKWLEINKECIQKAIQINQNNKKTSIAAQLVLDKEVLVSDNFCDNIKRAYNENNYEYIFIWIDNFNSFDTKREYMKAFADLITTLNAIGKKPIMAYGGYESIILCNEKSPYRLYGVAQSVGYGEYRSITPVGGGMPTNKYYFYPLHQRMRFDDAAKILSTHGYFDDKKKPSSEHATDYYTAICNCKQCQKVIRHNMHNFVKYNDSTSFPVHTKNGVISRNRPTAEAELIAAFHFLYCKVNEWENADEEDFKTLVTKLKNNYKLYQLNQLRQIAEWCEIYGHKKN